MVRIVLSARMTKVTSIVARGLQCLLAMVALITVNSGFINLSETRETGRLGSHDASFAMLTTYSSMMYAAWFAVFVELHPMVARPRRLMVRAIDVTLAFFLLASAIALAGSDYVQKCYMYSTAIRCKTLQASVVFNFLSVVPLFVTIALTFATSNTDSEIEVPDVGYVLETTPTAAVFSPRPVANAPPTPSSKV